MGPRVFMTLLTRPSYLPGTLVLHYSLQATKTKYELVVVVTRSLPAEARDILERSGITVKEVDLLTLPSARFDPAKTAARFADIWTKARVFGMKEYDKICFLDSDMLICRNLDDIFEYSITPNQVAATYVCACNPRKILHYPKDWVPANCGYSQPNYFEAIKRANSDPWYPAHPSPSPSTHPAHPPHLSHHNYHASKPRPFQLLNSGMFLCQPSQQLMARVKRMLDTSPLVPTWKFCDQDLIGTFFGGGGESSENWGDLTKEELGDPWMVIPYYYNALKLVRQTHPNLWKDEDIRVVHYTHDDKPWKIPPPKSSEMPYEETDRWWWKSYESMITAMADAGRVEDITYIEGLVGPRH